MKKQLMAGTAFIAAAMLVAGAASAQDKKMADKKKMMKPSISIGGSFESVVGGLLEDNLETKFSYVPTDSEDSNTTADVEFTDEAAAAAEKKKSDVKDTSALDTKTDAEIHFNGRAQLDNGLKIHARVELEGGNSPSDPVDEHFLSLSGGFGEIVLGGTAGAPVRMLTPISGSFATGVGESLNFDLNDWAGTASGHPKTFGVLRHARLDTGDAEKVTYISPKFGGFQIGLTYSPNRENDDDNSRVNADTGYHDGLEFAVGFDQKFGDIGIGIGAGMTAYSGAETAGPSEEPETEEGGASGAEHTHVIEAGTPHPTGDLSDWLVAARLDFGSGFRIAATYKKTEGDNKAGRGSVFDAGVRYVAGANQFSVTGSYGELDNGEANHTSLMGSYARSLGPGVTTHVNLAWTQSESNVTATDERFVANGDPYTGDPASDDWVQQYGQQEQSAIVLIAGIKVTF